MSEQADQKETITPEEREELVRDSLWCRNLLLVLCLFNVTCWIVTSRGAVDYVIAGSFSVLFTASFIPFHRTYKRLLTGTETRFDTSVIRELNLPAVLPRILPLHKLSAPKAKHGDF